MKLLILGSTILAADFTESADEFQTADQIIPKHVIAGYEVHDVDVPADFTVHGYVWPLAKKPEPVAPTPVPAAVSPRQIRQALTRAGLRTAVESAIAAGDQDTKDWYEFATAFERTNAHVIAMGQALGVSEQQLDDLWVLAGTL